MIQTIKNLFNVLVELYIYGMGIQLMALLHIDTKLNYCFVTTLMVCCMSIHVRNQTGDTFFYLQANGEQCSEQFVLFAKVMEIFKEAFYPLVYQLIYALIVSFFCNMQKNI